MLSKKCAHAIRAMMQLTLLREADPDSRIKAAELAQQLNIPPAMLSKVLYGLTEHGLIQSFKGPSGGVLLHRTPSSIQILDIVHAVEGEEAFNHCIMGFEQCSCNNPCPMHKHWKSSRASMIEHLATVNLSDWCHSRHRDLLSQLTDAQSGAGI